MAPAARKPTNETLWLLEDAEHGDVESAIERLADTANIDVNYADRKTGFTVLHYAALMASRPLIRALAATGQCDFTRVDRQGRTAATLAVTIADDPVLGRYLYDRQYAQEGNQAPRKRQRARANLPAKAE